MNLKQKLAAALKRANELLAKATVGTASESEITELKAVTEEARGLKAQIDAADDGAERFREFFGNESGRGGKASRLDLSGLTDALAGGMKGYSDRVSPGIKGVAPTGEAVVAIPLVSTDPIPGSVDQETPPRLVDVLPVAVRPPFYEFLRQSVIASPGGADVVEMGGLKPSLKLGVEKVPAHLSVIAVLSEAQDRFLLEDSSNLRTWIGAELGDAIQRRLETEVLSGDGTGAHLLGLASVSGVQTQAFVTDAITTVAAGVSKLEALGITPAWVALSAADWLAISTARHSGGGFDLGSAVDAATRRLWGVQAIVIPGLSAGDGWIVGDNTVELAVDDRGVRLDWGSPGDQFNRNQITARCEGRFGFQVNRPHGVVRLDLSA